MFNNHDNKEGGHILIDGKFFTLLAGLLAFAFLVYKALNFALGVLALALDRANQKFEQLRDTLADPVIFRYFVLIAVTVFFTAIGITYLIRRFQLFNYIKNFFTNEDDIDW